MKNGVHLSNSSKVFFSLNFSFMTLFFYRFFQRMAIFTLYFGICLFGLLIRGYYRVPSSCIFKEEIDKEEHTFKSIIVNKSECKCHYTSFLWRKPFINDENQTIMNISLGINTYDDDENNQRIFEPMVIVRKIRKRKINDSFLFSYLISVMV
jgi:hypothetical protein